MATIRERERNILLKEKKWKKEKEIRKRELDLYEEKIHFLFGNRKKSSTSKLLIFFLFLNCTLIEFFVGWVTIKSLNLSALTMLPPDMTPLVTLVGAVVSEVIGYAVYSIKSTKENTVGGITYDMAMRDANNADTDSAID